MEDSDFTMGTNNGGSFLKLKVIDGVVEIEIVNFCVGPVRAKVPIFIFRG